MKSLKELFRVGRGPSSSHTMAPFRAAEMFLAKYPGASRFRVKLYGSLAATGRGHFTDTAIGSVLGKERTALEWHPEIILPEHPNGMIFRACDAAGKTLGEWKVFSVGGGDTRVMIVQLVLKIDDVAVVLRLSRTFDGRPCVGEVNV